MMILHVCAITVAVQSFDALTVVFLKDGHILTKEKAKENEKMARSLRYLETSLEGFCLYQIVELSNE